MSDQIQLTRAQAIEAQDRCVVGIVDCKKGFCATGLMALSRIAAQEVIQRMVATIEHVEIMLLADRLFMPRRHSHVGIGAKAFAVAQARISTPGLRATHDY